MLTFLGVFLSVLFGGAVSVLAVFVFGAVSASRAASLARRHDELTDGWFLEPRGRRV